MTQADEFSPLTAAALRRLARELRHDARSPATAPRERQSLLIRAAHAAELAEQKEPWMQFSRKSGGQYPTPQWPLYSGGEQIA